MEFGRDQGFYGEEEEEHLSHKDKHPFSNYSFSTSHSSSSSHFKPQNPALLTGASRWDSQIHNIGSWLGNRYDPDEEYNSKSCSDGGVTGKLDFMDASPATELDEPPQADSDSSSSVLELHRTGGATADTVLPIEKEHMFDKVVTPSDVGKLNRLVIPKQHAEKYFPLDSSSNEKGLLLNFEDRNGKAWRFRYSYWNSSQSYVMTKGWSRFVKEKKLDAGDIVSFQRGVGEAGKDRLYIDWRRRPDAPDPTHHFPLHRSIPWSPLLLRPQTMARDHHFHLPHVASLNRASYYGGSVVNPVGTMGSVLYLRPGSQQMGMVEWPQHQHQREHPMVFDSVPVVHGKAAAKRLRLFGVNMDCPISNSEEHETLTHLSSSSSSSQHSLQLRLYNGTPFTPTDFLNKEN